MRDDRAGRVADGTFTVAIIDPPVNYESILRDWLLALIAALLAVQVLAETGTQFLFPLLAPIANVLALVTFLAFVIATGAFLFYAASFRD